MAEAASGTLIKVPTMQVSYKWIIEDFFDSPYEIRLRESPVFPIEKNAPAAFRLILYPGRTLADDKNSIALYFKLVSCEDIELRATFYLESNIDGKMVGKPFSKFLRCLKEFSEDDVVVGCHTYVTGDSLRKLLKNSKSKTWVIDCDVRIFRLPFIKPEHSSDFSSNAIHDGQLSQHLQFLLTDESFSDLVIKIQNRQFKVHKCILHARSSVFAAMFSSRITRKLSEVTLVDVDPNAFEKVLQFMYTGKLTVNSDAWDILPLADEYDIVSLKKQCADLLAAQLCSANAVKTLLFADKYKLEDLKKVAIPYICWYAHLISKTEDWSQFVASFPKLAAEISSALTALEEEAEKEEVPIGGEADTEDTEYAEDTEDSS